jgi:4-hydroxy-tetrahydrodipicolinate reductase
MKIALLGYGKMGKEIEQLALQRNHEIKLIIDVNNKQDFTVDNLKKCDVAIDFSIPESAFDNILKCFEAGLPIVCGTTGWMSKFEEAVDLCKKNDGCFFYASNFSLGVNIFFKLNNYLAQIMDKFPAYDVEMEETHHIQKLDAPSGTAISLAEGILKNLTRKKSWKLGNTDNESELKIDAIRKDTVPGIHTIVYDSAVDYIEITHSSKNRKGLATGAMMAAEFIKGKKGVYGMEQMLNIG